MRVLVFSDTHGDVGAMLDVIASVPCSRVLHLGDCTGDCDDARMLFPALTFWQVAGNDFRDRMSGLFYEDVYDLDGVRIFAAHGHRHAVQNGPDALCACAAAQGARLALFGHTHVPALGVCGGVTYFNPGSISRPRGGSRTYGVIDIENGAFACRAVEL